MSANNARKAPRDFDAKKKAAAPAGEEAAPAKNLSRREQKLRAELAASVANEKKAMQGVDATPDNKKKGDTNAKGANNNNRTQQADGGKKVHPITAAFGNSASNEASYGKNPVDFCGKGHPFDRLQFGYSPSDNDEARAYHSQFTAQQWVKARSANYKTAIVKRQKLPKLNCEPLTTMFKLKRYWASLNTNENNAGGNIFDGAFAEDLLEQLASKQLRADEGALSAQ